MNIFEKIIYFFSKEMNTPMSYGWYHFLWIGLIILSLIVLYLCRKKYNIKQVNTVLLIYSITTIVLEILKQLIFSFNYVDGVVTFDYQWYAFPFQFCSMPMFVCLIAAFTKNITVRNSLLSYIVFFTILGSLVTIILPDTCFCSYIEVNIHTMFLHCMSFVVSLYLIASKTVMVNIKNYLSGAKVAMICIMIALLMDIVFYKFNIVSDETFNMFFISPYFPSTLPVFSSIYDKIPYIIFLLLYIIVILLGGFIIFGLFKLIQRLLKNK